MRGVPRERRARGMGLMIAASSAGYALCLGLAALALRFTGWRGALLVIAGIAAVIGAIVAEVRV